MVDLDSVSEPRRSSHSYRSERKGVPLRDRCIATFVDWIERGYVPDPLTRWGIRRLLEKRLAKVDQGECELNQQRLESLIETFSRGPIAIETDKANQQHYEVPASIYERMLGPRKKYSCCWWPDGVSSLSQAEEAALAETVRRAEIQDGQHVLELGCGWGSLTLWMAEKFPEVNITAVSNSSSQRRYIEQQATRLGLSDRIHVITADINEFSTTDQFDRVVSVEMFEHVRNHPELLSRIAGWLRSDGKLFVHIFCHREFAYEFQDEGQDDWMSRYFFSGGMMPSDDWLTRFQADLTLIKKWRWNGRHYQRTCDAWLSQMDQHREEILPLMIETYGAEDGARWFQRWRMFHMACSELFGMQRGQQWWVSHYLFQKR